MVNALLLIAAIGWTVDFADPLADSAPVVVCRRVSANSLQCVDLNLFLNEIDRQRELKNKLEERREELQKQWSDREHGIHL